MILQKRYKQLLQVVFYAAALALIVFNLVLAFVGFNCHDVSFVLQRLVEFLNLIIGSYIATQLKILSLQLEELIASKDEILSVQDPDALTPWMRIRRLKRGKQRAYTLFVLQILVVMSFCIFDIIYTSPADSESCSEKNREGKILVHEMCKLIPSIIIIVCICEPSCKLKKILKSKMEDTSSFKLEMSKIHCTNFTIILSIAFQCFAYILVSFWAFGGDKDYKKIRTLYSDMSFVTQALPSLLPVMIVLINHFTSLHSFARIFKMLCQKDQQSVDSSLSQYTVYLDAATEENESQTVKSSRDKSS